jgi:DNA polymerase sigma
MLLFNQGYVQSMQDQTALQSLSYKELCFVHDFYTVLEAQIEAVKNDQVYKLRKAQKLREIAFEMIKSKILNLYSEKQRKKNQPGEKLKVKVEKYGSMATGLAIDSSDLDILVHDFIDQSSPRFRQLSREELIDEMKGLHAELSTLFAIQSNQLIESASVPVIKMQIDLVLICE